MPKGYFKPFTPADEAKIKKEYLQKPVKRLADEIGCTYGRIMRFLDNHNLKIPKHVVEQRKRNSWLKKGNIPPNKGKKQTEYMTAEGIERAKKTRFKKGSSPANILKVGTVRIGPGGYVEIKVANPNKWQLKQRLIYEKHYKTKLTKDDVVIFKDKNKYNFQIANLKRISREENMLRNSKVNYPTEVIETLVLINKVKKQLTS